MSYLGAETYQATLVLILITWTLGQYSSPGEEVVLKDMPKNNNMPPQTPSILNVLSQVQRPLTGFLVRVSVSMFMWLCGCACGPPRQLCSNFYGPPKVS